MPKAGRRSHNNKNSIKDGLRFSYSLPQKLACQTVGMTSFWGVFLGVLLINSMHYNLIAALLFSCVQGLVSTLNGGIEAFALLGKSETNTDRTRYGLIIKTADRFCHRGIA